MDYYDDLETRAPQAREAALFAALPKQIAHAKKHAPAFARMLADVDAKRITDRAALAALPVVRKSALIELQCEAPPFGGLAAMVVGFSGRVFASPGPIYEPEGMRPDYWRAARALFAAGVRKGELVHNAFSYQFTTGGFIIQSGALALGCMVFPAGTGQTEQQVAAIAALRPQAYAGTPSFLKIILDKSAEMGMRLDSITKALVSGEALPPGLRAQLRERGVDVLQCYATADLGLIAYESEAAEGMIVDEGVIVEIVRPGTGTPVAAGEVGEVVVTTLTPEYPLIRFATGDLSAVLPGTSPCGRTNRRIKGWMGRADRTTKIKGMFVHPAQVAEIAKRHPELGRLRLVITRANEQDVMTLVAESAAPQDDLRTADFRT